MQAALEKIFQDKTQSTDYKLNLVRTILTKIPNIVTKTAFIKNSISFLLLFDDNLQRLQLLNALFTELQETQLECYTLEDIKSLVEEYDELAILVMFTNLFLKTSQDRTKALQMKNLFLKTIKKDEVYWFTDSIKEFSIQKKAQITPASNQNLQSSLQSPLLDFQYDKHLFQVNLVFSFFQENPTFYPPNFDSKDITMKWFFTIRNQTSTEKQLQARMIEQLLNFCRTSNQFYVTCFKYIIQLLRFNYMNSDIFECPSAAYNFLEQTDPKAIEDFMRPLMVGDPTFNTQDWLRIFKNFAKVGLTENIGVAFLTLAKGFENMKAFELLLCLQEEIFSIVIVSLKWPQYQESALHILNFLILQGPVNTALLLKLKFKLFSAAKEVCKNNISQFSSDLVSFLYHLKVKYLQSSLSEELELEYKNLLEECKIDAGQVNHQKYSIIPWTIMDKQPPQHPQVQKQSKSKYKGLNNLGNTCYMNSFVQALFMTKLFRFRILNLEDLVQKVAQMQKLKEDDSEVGKNLTLEKKKATNLFQLQKLFALLASSEREAVSPNFLKATLPGHFRTSYSQEDTMEFGRVYLDDLEKSLTNTEEKNMIKELFTGEIVSKITCQECKTEYRKVDSFMDLSLNFESKDPNLSYEMYKLIYQNFEPIEFKDTNKYFCDKCQKHAELAIKTHKPTRLPPMLILTINRFYFDTQTFQRVKILSHIDILEEIVLNQENEDGIIEEIKYDLYAIIVHRGMTLDYGHYYAAAKENFEDGSWILFDDANTINLKETNLDPFEYVKNNKQDAPYILFYQARDYFNQSIEKFKDFKLTTSLKRIVEEDSVHLLKEIDRNTKLMATLTAFNVPNKFMTGPAFKKDNDDDEDNPSKGGFDSVNRFIM